MRNIGQFRGMNLYCNESTQTDPKVDNASFERKAILWGRDVLIISQETYQQYKGSFPTQLSNENPWGTDKSLDDFRYAFYQPNKV